jgi:hypothetical protein
MRFDSCLCGVGKNYTEIYVDNSVSVFLSLKLWENVTFAYVYDHFFERQRALM